MKSEKLKKLLKKIKKLRKLRKVNKIKKTKKTKIQNLGLSADIETLKQKLKNQEIQLSQMKYPQQAPVSTVSYEKLGIGQQNALNQANLENIQKNIETKLEDQSKLIDLPTALLNIKQRGLKPQKENQSDEDYAKYVKRSITNRSNYEKRKLKKSIDTPKESSGVKNKINTKGTLKKPIYNDNDNQGDFPATSFDEDFEQINNEITSSLNQIDSKEDLTSAPDVQNQQFIDTSNDQNVVLKNETTQPKQIMSRKELRKFNKMKNKTENINLRGMNISLGKNVAKIDNVTNQMNNESQEVNEIAQSLGLFTDS
jgi:hypothetical protein